MDKKRSHRQKPNKKPGQSMTIFGAVIFAVAFICLISGCKNKPGPNVRIVASVGETRLLLADFDAYFDLATAGFGAHDLDDAADRHEARLRFLQQMVEEMLVLEWGRCAGVTISPAQVDEAENQIRKDYPDNSFEEMLICQAVPYKTWRKSLTRRLLVEKVIDFQVRVRVSEEEISQYLEQNPFVQESKPEQNPNQAGKAEEIKTMDVSQTRQDIKALARKQAHDFLKAMKTETAYGKWLMELKKEYSAKVRHEFLNQG